MIRLFRIPALAWGVALLASLPGAAHGGSFNCAVVYDEFESLMNKRFLVEPGEFVRTLPGRISKQQFEGVSNADFHLYPGRENLGIGILRTNLNVHAKFLFHWSQPMADGTVHVILDVVVKYGRVSDGYAPQRIGPFRLRPGMAIDIDSGDYVPMEAGIIKEDPDGKRHESGDLNYEVGPQGTVLKSVNGAEVEFPLETMCQQGSA